jgi:hypothetical protein
LTLVLKIKERDGQIAELLTFVERQEGTEKELREELEAIKMVTIETNYKF